MVGQSACVRGMFHVKHLSIGWGRFYSMEDVSRETSSLLVASYQAESLNAL